ncbi:Hypothetical protein FKW44_020944, partial [Caligus rogercresseyi]
LSSIIRQFHGRNSLRYFFDKTDSVILMDYSNEKMALQYIVILLRPSYFCPPIFFKSSSGTQMSAEFFL